MTKLPLLTLLLPLCAGAAYADEPVIGFYAGGSGGLAVLHRERIFRSGIEADDQGFKVGEIDVFNASAVGLIQLREWDLFGKVGLGRWDGTTANNAGREVKDHDVDPMIGIGAQYRNGRFALRVESEAQQLSFSAGSHGRDGDLINFFSLGATVAF